MRAGDTFLSCGCREGPAAGGHQTVAKHGRGAPGQCWQPVPGESWGHEEAELEAAEAACFSLLLLLPSPPLPSPHGKAEPGWGDASGSFLRRGWGQQDPKVERRNPAPGAPVAKGRRGRRWLGGGEGKKQGWERKDETAPGSGQADVHKEVSPLGRMQAGAPQIPEIT